MQGWAVQGVVLLPWTLGWVSAAVTAQQQQLSATHTAQTLARSRQQHQVGCLSRRWCQTPDPHHTSWAVMILPCQPYQPAARFYCQLE